MIDINDPSQLRELYELLSGHYVEDDDASFRFQYSAEFLSWYAIILTIYFTCITTHHRIHRALKPPGYHPDWHVGVRVASSKKLVAFISAIPITVRVREKCVGFFFHVTCI